MEKIVSTTWLYVFISKDYLKQGIPSLINQVQQIIKNQQKRNKH